LHSWFPLLEGYSPKFVEQIITNFSSKARRVLDPFSGTGTTPLTVASLGREALYCELNPLLQFLTKVKSAALNLKDSVRLEISQKLRATIPGLEYSIANSLPDQGLMLAYTAVFGRSWFFDEHVLEVILRTRTYLDSVACTDPFLAELLTVATLATLVPASRLTRAGDLRFKTPEESEKEHVDFMTYLRERIVQIADDLTHISTVDTKPGLLCEDARNLSVLPYQEIDTVITSPPYLNGTNYFRNTKIELWFLRCLSSAKDLASFRQRAVTAGINDVTHSKNGLSSSKEVAEVVSQLKQKAYDPRIPKMVGAYFLDMLTVFAGLRKHLTPDAVIAVDIGDSAYGGVRVLTDKLLVTLLDEQGYKLQEQIILRRRLSRSGLPLNQVLLVFSYRRARKLHQPEKPSVSLKAGWYTAWKDFTQELPHQKPPYSQRNWGHPLHSLCSYQGKMKPSLAAYLVRTLLRTPSTVLDPFAGVGTIPFEAALAGHRTYAFEISPAAYIIAAAKLGRPDSQVCEKVLVDLRNFLKTEQVSNEEVAGAEAFGFNGKLSDYYHKKTLREILLAKRFFSVNSPENASEYLVMASVLHILHGNRPYALSRRSHPITPFAPTGPFEYRPLLPRLQEKVERSFSVDRPSDFVEGKIFFQDATSWWPQEIDRLDAIITSPPFFDSTRFHSANWLRLWFCGWEVDDFRTKPLAFVDERQKTSFAVYESIFRQARERLKPGGVFVLHLGRSAKCDMSEELAKIGRRWFQVIDQFSETVTHCESHGIRDKGSVSEHQYLVLA
jgi:tRNA G10  N-methylase Trm11